MPEIVDAEEERRKDRRFRVLRAYDAWFGAGPPQRVLERSPQTKIAPDAEEFLRVYEGCGRDAEKAAEVLRVPGALPRTIEHVVSILYLDFREEYDAVCSGRPGHLFRDEDPTPRPSAAVDLGAPGAVPIGALRPPRR